MHTRNTKHKFSRNKNKSAPSKSSEGNKSKRDSKRDKDEEDDATAAIDAEFIDTYCCLSGLFAKASFRQSASLSLFVSTRKVGGSMVFPAGFRGCLTVVNDPSEFVATEENTHPDSEPEMHASAGYKNMYAEAEEDPEQRVLSMLEDDLVLGAIFGLAPSFAAKWSNALEARMYAYLAHPKAVAVGGCGLDFGLAQEGDAAVKRDAQVASLTKQIEIACKVRICMCEYARANTFCECVCEYACANTFCEYVCEYACANTFCECMCEYACANTFCEYVCEYACASTFCECVCEYACANMHVRIRFANACANMHVRICMCEYVLRMRVRANMHVRICMCEYACEDTRANSFCCACNSI
jgi:hypothetical protein